MKNQWTPEQKEQIINAVYDLYNQNWNFYSWARHISDMQAQILGNAIEIDKDGSEELTLSLRYLDNLNTNTMSLNELFFSLQKATTYESEDQMMARIKLLAVN